MQSYYTIFSQINSVKTQEDILLKTDWKLRLSPSSEYQFGPSVPQAEFLFSGGFLNFTEILGCPHEATAWNIHQCCCLNEADTFQMPELMLNNVVTSIKLSHVALIRVLLRQPPQNLFNLLAIILTWFLTPPDGVVCQWVKWLGSIKDNKEKLF